MTAQSPSDSSPSPREQEAQLLRYLCSQAGDAPARAEMIALLEQHRFAAVHHQVLYDCLKSLPAAARAEMFEPLLAARLVRAGFPDFDLQEFLRPSDLSAVQAAALLQALRANP